MILNRIAEALYLEIFKYFCLKIWDLQSLSDNTGRDAEATSFLKGSAPARRLKDMPGLELVLDWGLGAEQPRLL